MRVSADLNRENIDIGLFSFLKSELDFFNFDRSLISVGFSNKFLGLGMRVSEVMCFVRVHVRVCVCVWWQDRLFTGGDSGFIYVWV